MMVFILIDYVQRKAETLGGMREDKKDNEFHSDSWISTGEIRVLQCFLPSGKFLILGSLTTGRCNKCYIIVAIDK